MEESKRPALGGAFEWCDCADGAAFASLARGTGELSVAVLHGGTALHELRERLLQRLLVRQDVEHPALLERRGDDLLVEVGRDVDAAVRDAVVVRDRRRVA